MVLRSFLRLLPQLVQIVDPALPQRIIVARLGRQHQGVFQIIAEVLREFLRPLGVEMGAVIIIRQRVQPDGSLLRVKIHKGYLCLFQRRRQAVLALLGEGVAPGREVEHQADPLFRAEVPDLQEICLVLFILCRRIGLTLGLHLRERRRTGQIGVTRQQVQVIALPGAGIVVRLQLAPAVVVIIERQQIANPGTGRCRSSHRPPLVPAVRHIADIDRIKLLVHRVKQRCHLDKHRCRTLGLQGLADVIIGLRHRLGRPSHGVGGQPRLLINHRRDDIAISDRGTEEHHVD